MLDFVDALVLDLPLRMASISGCVCFRISRAGSAIQTMEEHVRAAGKPTAIPVYGKFQLHVNTG